MVEKAISEIIEEYSKIDVLINNAGLWIQEELDTNDSDRIKSDWEGGSIYDNYGHRSRNSYRRLRSGIF